MHLQRPGDRCGSDFCTGVLGRADFDEILDAIEIAKGLRSGLERGRIAGGEGRMHFIRPFSPNSIERSSIAGKLQAASSLLLLEAAARAEFEPIFWLMMAARATNRGGMLCFRKDRVTL